MYDIITTEAFIIDAKPLGEADKIISFFTKELGLLRAIAKGIRLEKSKLRGFVTEYSFGTFSFVRGHEFWRLTDACSLQKNSDKSNHHLDTESILSIKAGIAILLKRLLHGEGAHKELFATICAGLRYIEENKINNEEMKVLSSLMAGRILYWLGYMNDEDGLLKYLVEIDMSLATLNNLVDKRVLLNKHVNRALRESHL